MQPQWLRYVLGYAVVEVRGTSIEALLNSAYEQRMGIWDIRKKAADVAELNVTLRDFFRLRPLLKRTGCRVHVTGRHGLPFMLDKLWRRKFFVIGAIVFVIGLYVLSSLVWEVKVEGNEHIAEDDVLQVARAEGIYRLQWKFRLRDADTLSRALQSKLPNATWVTVEFHGTQAIIKIVETTKPDQRQLAGPRHIVAAHDALVTQIYTEKGKPLAKPNSYVRKGDVLISGIIGDESNSQTVIASGKVKGIVWYQSAIEAPLSSSYRVFTGESFSRSYLVIGGRALKLTGYGKGDYPLQDVQQERKTFHLFGLTLPFGWLRETVREADVHNNEIAAKAAEEDGLAYAAERLLKDAGAGASIVRKTVLKRTTEGGKVMLQALFEVEQYIGVERPLADGT